MKSFAELKSAINIPCFYKSTPSEKNFTDLDN